MRIASLCQDRALLLLQVAQECPQFKEQAEFLAREWLAIAAVRIDLAKIKQAEKETASILG
jgi:hypothetical protein